MEGKTLTIIILFAIVLALIPVLVIVSFQLKPKGSPQPLQLEECKTLSYTDEANIDVLFISEKNDAEKYKDFILNTPPFDSNKDRFNFYYIDSYSPECEIYKGVAVLCRGKELTKKAASCPSDYIIVIKDIDDSSIRSSTLNNIVSINSNHPLTVFTHEFGHAFANLADEYIPATIPAGSKNCASSCDKFFQETDGCFNGCSDDSHFRSIDNGLMRTLSNNNYGVYNKKIIEEFLSKNKNNFISGSAISDYIDSDCSSNRYYLVEGYFSYGNYSVVSVSIEQGCPSSILNGDYNYSIILDGNNLEQGLFNVDKFWTEGPSYTSDTDLGHIDGGYENYEGSVYTPIPFIENAENIKIIDPDGQIYDIDIKEINSFPCLIENEI